MKVDESKPYFVKYRPAFFSGFKDEKYNFDSIDDLLKKNNNALSDGFMFACEYGFYKQTLMVSSTKKREWYVVGFVYNFDLSRYLPNFRTCYKLCGKVKVCMKDGNDDVYVVEDESKTGEYSLINIDKGYSWAWASPDEYKFTRYATDEEIEKANSICCGD